MSEFCKAMGWLGFGVAIAFGVVFALCGIGADGVVSAVCWVGSAVAGVAALLGLVLVQLASR